MFKTLENCLEKYRWQWLLVGMERVTFEVLQLKSQTFFQSASIASYPWIITCLVITHHNHSLKVPALLKFFRYDWKIQPIVSRQTAREYFIVIYNYQMSCNESVNRIKSQTFTSNFKYLSHRHHEIYHQMILPPSEILLSSDASCVRWPF